MAKFRCEEARSYPDLGLTLAVGDVVELPDETDVAGLIKITEKAEPKQKPSSEEKVGE